MDQYESPAADGGQVSHHRLSDKFLRPPLRVELDEFLAGSPMSSCLNLWREACKLKSIQLPERSVERIHAMGKAAISKAHNHGEDYFSVQTRRPQIENVLLEDPKVLREIATYQDQIRNADKMAEALHLELHPAVQLAQSADDRLTHKHMRKIIYRCDLESMHDRLSTTARGLLKQYSVAPGDEHERESEVPVPGGEPEVEVVADDRVDGV